MLVKTSFYLIETKPASNSKLGKFYVSSANYN